MQSPYKLATDSPSRQLLWELNQIAIANQKGFYAHLDQQSAQREATHRQALAEAAVRHEKVRKSAEHFQEQLILQEQANARRREEEKQKELARLRKENADLEEDLRRRQIELAEAERERERKISENKKKEAQAVEARKAEKARREAEEAERKREEQRIAEERKKEAAIAESKAKRAAANSQIRQSAPLPQPSAPPVQHSASSTNPRYEQEHRRFLEIHHNLKGLRKGMSQQAQRNPELKKNMGEWRRSIKKSVGQMREGKGANKVPLQTIITTLKQAATVVKPSVDIPAYLASPPAQVDNPKGPALLIYLLNIFAKAMIAQFIDEAGVKPQMADSLGTVASHVFALDAFRWHGVTLIDILIAKFHVVCPVLFGIYGDERTGQGRQRLGWWKEDKDAPFIGEQRHFERMTGLGAGYAGITLKNYEKANAKNPYPEHHYWQAFARVTSVPPNQITQTHFVVLKGMIEGYEEKFLMFYGDAAIAALRHALIELPRRSPPSVAAKALAGLVDIMKRDQKLFL